MTTPAREIEHESIATLSALAGERNQPTAPILHILFSEFLVSDPADTNWLNRDRLLVSARQCSAMLLAALHLAGYSITIDDLRASRRRTGMIPSYVSQTSIASSVNLAMVESTGADRLNRTGADIIDHQTFALVSTADLNAQSAPEAIALAGLFALGKLIVYCDRSAIGPERSDLSGKTASLSPEYFEQCGWHMPPPVRACDLDGIGLITRVAIADTTRPSLIRVDGCVEESAAGRSHGLDISKEVQKSCTVFRERGARRRAEWNDMVGAYHREHPIGSALLRRWIAQSSGNSQPPITSDGPTLFTQELIF